MATKVRVIKDDEGNAIAPVTSTKAVLNSAGQNVETLLDEKVGFKDAAGNPGIPLIPSSPSGTIDLSMTDIYGNYIGTRETANCYVINTPGDYKFPLIYGNAITGGVKNTEAYTNNGGTYQSDFVNMYNDPISSIYIEEDIGGNIVSAEILIADEPGIIDNLEIIDGFPCRFVKFHVDKIPQTGANFIIGIRNYGENDIAWSWHIWLWNQISHPLEEIEIKNHEGNTYKMLNYNLGTKFDDDLVHMKNWFYQWGRKDPMLLPKAYNNSTNHNSWGTQSYSFNNGAASNVSQAIQNPCTFYKNGGSTYKYNWVQLNYFFNYWDATCNATGYSEKTVVKTVYDPCPRGFSIPNARVFTGFVENGEYAECSDWDDNTDTGIWLPGDGLNGLIQPWQNGYNFYTASGDTVFFPASGCRIGGNGVVYGMGNGGYYWSAGAASEGGASRLGFYGDGVDPLSNNDRAYGYSVRPVFAS